LKALAIDLGGSHATCAVLEDEKILATERIVTEGAGGLADVLPRFAASLLGLLRRLSLSTQDVAGLGFGFCGLVDPRAGRVLSTNQKYEDGPRLDLPAWSKRELGLPLALENDARMALLGEWHAGSAKGSDDVVMFTLGTGIGGAAMIEGRLLRGKHFQAGCLGGHFPVLYTGRRCTCGNIGCAEAEAAGWSLPLVVKESAGYRTSLLAKEESIDFAKLFRLADAGDAVAIAVRDRCVQIWAATATAAIHAYDPELIVYGGGVMAGGAKILPTLQAYVERHAWTPWGKVKVRAASLGNDAGLLGAIPLLREARGAT
jgi:glucokinase